jgi:hypothetical protein
MLKYALTHNKSATPNADFLSTLKNAFPALFDKDEMAISIFDVIYL